MDGKFYVFSRMSYLPFPQTVLTNVTANILSPMKKVQINHEAHLNCKEQRGSMAISEV